MKDSILHHISKIALLKLVGEHGSLKRAAVEAGVTTSALSQSLATLELFMGKTLLHRKREGVSLSPDGIALVELSRPLIASFEAIDHTKTEAPHERISVGAYDSIAMTVFPRILASFRNQVPNLRLNVVMGRSHALYSWIKAGELDMALVVDAQDEMLVDNFPLSQERLGIYCSRRHPIADHGARAAHEFGVATISASPQGYPLYYQKFYKEIGEPSVIVSTDSFEAVRSLLLSGAVAGILPVRVAQRNADELIEITPPNLRAGHRGEHRFSLICRRNIDARLRDFVLSQLQAAFEVEGEHSPG